MSQVSHYPLHPDIKERLFEVLRKVLINIKTNSDAEILLTDLLTPTERIMIAKRLGIALLLIKKHNYENIKDILKVSTTTIASVALWLKTEGLGYRKSLEKIIKEEKQEEFWDNVEEKISSIIPPRRGTNWSQELSKKHANLRTRRHKRTL